MCLVNINVLDLFNKLFYQSLERANYSYYKCLAANPCKAIVCV